MYQVSETLTFELKPVGKTSENIQKSGLLQQDFKRAEDYPEVKKFLDEQHKLFLQKVLSGITDINWTPLAEQITEFQKNKDLKADLEKSQAVYRKKIADQFTSDDFYSILVKESTPSKLFKQLLENPSGVSEKIQTFARFACYFKGYQENRKNIYSPEAQQTSAANRAVNENFSKFFNAVNIFADIQNKYPDLVTDMEARTGSIRNGKELTELFNTDSYNQFLPQSGIDFINAVIGEINYAINQYRQQHKEIKSRNLPFMPLLYKQILSDREQSFVIESFQNDKELCSALQKYSQSNQELEIFGEHAALFSSLCRILKSINADSDLYIDAKSLDRISVKTTGSWNTLQEAMSDFARKNYKTKKEQEKYCKQAVFHLNEIQAWDISVSNEDGEKQKIDITDFWKGEHASKLFSGEKELLPSFEEIVKAEHKNLREDKEKVHILKEYLDTVQEILHLLKPLCVGEEYGGDLNLLGILKIYYSQLEKVIPLYNHTRNYMTQKAVDKGKIKLMFDKPTLADGWDNNKEKDNNAVLFRKDENFYLGIMNPKAKTDFAALTNNSDSDGYQKMVYKLLPGPNKMLPKVFFSKKGIETFSPDTNLLRRYKNNEHLKGDKFNVSFCHELIDYFKKSISIHPDWSKFGFKFSPTKSYKGIDDFYREITDQGYMLNFVNIPQETVDNLVEEGKLYLFQIWNKDFSPKSTGKPNKFTLYWKTLFDPQNLKDVIFKLNGEAEIFIREKVGDPEAIHAKGSKLVNRTIITGFEDKNKEKAIRQPVPEKIHNELVRYVNGRIKEEELSKETQEFRRDHETLYWEKGMPVSNAENKIVVKEASFDLIKDKRFTEDKYSFHVPITINFKSPAKPAKFNEQVLDSLRDNPDVKIIGLDRGERNLIYLTLIDQQGQILQQKSLNLINNIDYQAKLDQREQERQEARKSWNAIGKIKDLKAGYLSGAVYEIVRMMVENNAIIVMEDLNTGFKRGRMKIEKQIYQKFEKALIDKLNYLVFKDQKDPQAPGGVLAGYQLANKFESFAKLGKQCGFIFYVPAGFTSKIDPATGFVNIFNTKECTNADSIKAFFDRFDSITYSEKQQAFAFEFDYRKFKTYQEDFRNKWIVYTLREAWQQEKDPSNGKYHPIRHNPTKEIKNAVIAMGIPSITDGFDLLDLLRKTESSKQTASFFNTVFYAFKHSTALRHTREQEDQIISPVMNPQGEFFISRNDIENNPMPQDADANGAFHIALKGVYLLKNCIKGGKVEKISNEEWLKFAQTRNK